MRVSLETERARSISCQRYVYGHSVLGKLSSKKLSLIIFNLNYLTFLGFDYMHDTQILPIKIYIISIILKYTIICMFILL